MWGFASAHRNDRITVPLLHRVVLRRKGGLEDIVRYPLQRVDIRVRCRRDRRHALEDSESEKCDCRRDLTARSDTHGPHFVRVGAPSWRSLTIPWTSFTGSQGYLQLIHATGRDLPARQLRGSSAYNLVNDARHSVLVLTLEKRGFVAFPACEEEAPLPLPCGFRDASSRAMASSMLSSSASESSWSSSMLPLFNPAGAATAPAPAAVSGHSSSAFCMPDGSRATSGSARRQPASQHSALTSSSRSYASATARASLFRSQVNHIPGPLISPLLCR